MDITETQIENFIKSFYTEIDKDNLLGPIFNDITFKAINIAKSLKLGILITKNNKE